MKFSGSPTAKFTIVLLSFAPLGLSSACIIRQPESTRSNQSTTTPARQDQNLSDSPSTTRININTAPAAELEKLPGIGRGFAQRIVEHRDRYGPFRRPEHLIMVPGVSD